MRYTYIHIYAILSISIYFLTIRYITYKKLNPETSLPACRRNRANKTGHSRRPPPQGYPKTLQQILRADRAVFTKLIQQGISLWEDAIISVLSSYDVGFHLMPLPKPVQPSPPPKSDPVKQQDQWWSPNQYQQYHRWNPYKRNKGNKRKGKGSHKRIGQTYRQTPTIVVYASG